VSDTASNTSSRRAVGMPAFAKGHKAYHWAWAEYIQNAPIQDPSDRSVAADVLFRQEPDEEEEEDEGDGKDDDDDDDETLAANFNSGKVDVYDRNFNPSDA